MDNDNLSLIAYLDKAQERMPFSKGCRHTELVSLAGCMNQKGFDKEEAVEECVRRFEEPDFPASEIRGIFDSVYGLYAAQFGEKKNIKNVKSFKSLNGSLSQEEEEEMIDEQDYFTRVQCEQPDISTFYNQLPDLLKERIERNVNPSIQWLQLICSITAFSGMTANTFFYAEGEKTLNLSTLVIGVSGSGKSKMDGSLDLIKMYSRYVKADFHEKVVVPAEQRLREWEDRQKQAKQDGEAPEAGEKPTVPEDKHLMSSFTTSTEGLISRVSANAPYTTFVTTNEIGEGASTGKRDYGVKNDQRCKLIEGEDVSTDYKSSGFTGVENPRYTELASGTPASVQRFLGNKEDGLTARYLYVSLPGIREYEKLKSARLGEMREKEQKLCSQVETFARMCITKYCEVVFSDRILEIIQNKIMILRKLYIPFGSDSDVSYVNRLRLKAMKICGIIAFMEAFQNNSLCGDSDENHPLPIHCSEDIATMVTSWLPYLAYTACMQTTPLRSSKASGVSFKSVKEQKFFALHPAEFTTEESERWGKMVNMSRPQSYRFRKKMVKLGVFQKIEHGKFRNTIV